LDNGILNFDDTLFHTLQFVVKDRKQNTSKLTFTVKGEKIISNSCADQDSLTDSLYYFFYDQENQFKAEGVILTAPKNAFYNSFAFHYEVNPAIKNAFSAVHTIHDPNVPIHLNCELQISADSLPDSLQTYALIGKVDENGNLRSAGGQFEAGIVTTNIRNFGNYCVVIDTVAPVIQTVKSSLHKNLAGQRSVSFIIKDEFSGISNFEGKLNGDWVLMEFDSKKNKLTYSIDERLKKGENDFELKITDRKGNESVYKTILTR